MFFLVGMIDGILFDSSDEHGEDRGSICSFIWFSPISSSSIWQVDTVWGWRKRFWLHLVGASSSLWLACALTGRDWPDVMSCTQEMASKMSKPTVTSRPFLVHQEGTSGIFQQTKFGCLKRFAMQTGCHIVNLDVQRAVDYIFWIGVFFGRNISKSKDFSIFSCKRVLYSIVYSLWLHLCP